MPAIEGSAAASARPGLLVEFVGLPGAGKSSIALRVGQLLAARGLAVEHATYPLAHAGSRIARRRRKLAAALHGLARSPSHAWRVAGVVRRADQRRFTDAARLVLNAWMIAGALRHGDVGPRLCLADQGMGQLAWSILLGARQALTEEVVEAMLATVPGPLTVIALHASLDTIARRLAARERPQSRLERAGPASCSLARGETVLRELLAALARRAPAVRTLVFDNDDDAGHERVAWDIVRRLEEDVDLAGSLRISTG
jgi:thymidylate kinase